MAGLVNLMADLVNPMADLVNAPGKSARILLEVAKSRALPVTPFSQIVRGEWVSR
jgi:hypothetical protein